MSDAMVNLGVHVLNEPTSREPRTIVVLGLARGGTSMVAGALFHLGVFMGDNVHPTTFEDNHLSNPLDKGKLGVARRFIAERNDRYDVWGWKRPSSFRYLNVVAREFRNPHYVMVCRDLLAVATRRQLTAGHDVVFAMRRALKAHSILIEFVAETTSPVLLLSYEKCIHRPAETAQSLATFAGTELTEAAVSFIQPDPPEYLESAWGTRERLRRAREAAAEGTSGAAVGKASADHDPGR